MNREEFLKKYMSILFDKKNRLNVKSFKSKKIDLDYFNNSVLKLTENFPKSISIKYRLHCIIQNIQTWPMCEVCSNPVKISNKTNPLKFTPFCSFSCSRTKGSSTFKKAQQTCLEKYGVKSNLVTQEALNSRRLNGGIGSANPNIREKIKKTNLEKYGCENVFSNSIIKEKIIKTHIEKYGGNFHTIKLGNKLEKLNDKEYCQQLANTYCLSTISDLIGVATNTIYKYFEKHGIHQFNNLRSNQEVQLKNFLIENNIKNIKTGDKTIISPYEIDIFLPDYSIGIELNGIYWHSQLANCRPNYHFHKFKKANNANIFLIQIFENEWVLKNDIVKNRLKSLLNLNSKKIAARDCEIKFLNLEERKKFLQLNHLQGNANSIIDLGLFYANELVSCATFSPCRFDKNIDFELIRFCTAADTTVIGGFSKLLNKFKQLNPNKTIVSYSDNRWSNGNIYKKNGFKNIGISNPSYFYFKGSSLILENRIKFQKHKLKKLLNTFDDSKSEWENMQIAGYNRIWDCGTTKWLLE